MKRNIIFTPFLMLLMTQFVGAQEQTALQVTLDEAIRIALERNHDLSAARFEVTKADKQVKEAFGLALPSVDFAATYSRALKRPVFFLPDFDDPESGRVVPIQIGSENSIDLTFSARQVLFNSAVFTGVGTAKIYSEAAHDLYQAKENATVASVRRAFYSVLLAGEGRTIMHSTLKNAEENLKNARVLSSAGLVSEYDALRAEVSYENLKPDVMKAEDDYVLALNTLRIAMGISAEQPLEVVGLLQPDIVDEQHLTNAVEDAVKMNPSLEALRKQTDVNEAIVSIERSNYLPTLSAFGNYQLQAQKNQFNFSTNDFIGSSVVGVNLSFNVFKGFQTNARVEQATLDHRRSQEQLASMESTLRTQVESMILRLRWAQKQIGVHEKTIAQAEKGYRIVATRFASGSGTQLEVNDAQLALNRAQVNRIEAIYQYLLAATDIEQALGGLNKHSRKIQ